MEAARHSHSLYLRVVQVVAGVVEEVAAEEEEEQKEEWEAEAVAAVAVAAVAAVVVLHWSPQVVPPATARRRLFQIHRRQCLPRCCSQEPERRVLRIREFPNGIRQPSVPTAAAAAAGLDDAHDVGALVMVAVVVALRVARPADSLRRCLLLPRAPPCARASLAGTVPPR